MSDAIPVRVMVHAAWDEIELALPPTATVAELKRAALARARVTRAPEAFEVKYRGAVVDDARTLGDAGIVPNAHVIVLSRRRLPVR